MKFSKRSLLLLTTAAAASFAAACVTDKNTKTDAAKTSAPAKPAPAVTTASAKDPGYSFTAMDAARVQAQKGKPIVLSDAQKKADDAFMKKFFPLRDAWRKTGSQKDYDALYALTKDPSASMEARKNVYLAIVETADAKRNNALLFKITDEALANRQMPSAMKVRFLQFRLNAYKRQNDHQKQAETMLAQLGEAMDQKVVYWQKRNVISEFSRAGRNDIATKLYFQFTDDKTLDTKQQSSIWYEAVSFALKTKDSAALVKYSERVLGKAADPECTQKANQVLQGMSQLKMDKERMAFGDAILNDAKLPANLRVSIFMERAEKIRHSQYANKRRIFYLLGNTLLKNTKANPRFGRPVIADAAEEVKARAEEDLRWVVPALNEAALPPDEYARIVSYLSNLAINDLRSGDLLIALDQALIARADVKGTSKLGAYDHAINRALNKGDFATANKLADEAAKLDGLVQDSDQYITAVCFKAYVLRIQDRCDDAVAHIRSKIGKKNNKWCWKLIEMYSAFGRTEDVIKVRIEFGDKAGALSAMAERWPDKAKAWALQALNNPQEDEKFRRYCVERIFFGGSAEARAMRKKHADLLKKTGAGTYQNAARSAITYGDYALLEEMIAGWKEKAPKFDWQRVQMELQLYAVTGNKAKLMEMVQGADDCKDMKAEQKCAVKFCGGTLLLNDKAGEFTKFYKAFPFDKEMTTAKRADILLKAASLTVNARKDIITQEAYKTWESLYKPEPTKIYTLGFSDTPIVGLEGFLKHAGKAQIQLLDRKFGGNMDFLVTDVSTGNRAENIGTDKGKNRPTEMQAVCDENGIHFLFTAFDDKTREIEAGTVGAGSYEMYFAPGKGQPYFCFLPDLTNGTNSIWDSAYDNLQWHRIDNGKKVQQIKSERFFTKNGYVLYMYLSWEPFYDKLPETGDLWDFENVHWSRFGGFSWNGIKTVHGRSTWGHLKFDISPAQMLKIKQKLIYSAKRNYQAEKRTNAAIHGVIDRWKNDKVLGDPAFFKAYAEPLIKQLDSKLGAVKPDMTADEINDIYRN